MEQAYEISYTKHNVYNFEIKQLSEVELNTYINKLKSKGFREIEVYCDNICIYEKGEFADYELTF